MDHFVLAAHAIVLAIAATREWASRCDGTHAIDEQFAMHVAAAVAIFEWLRVISLFWA